MSDPPTILIVEDNDFVRMQIVSYLSAAGFNTREASEGDAALAEVEQDQDVDMAIVDVRMEPMGGFEFVKVLRSCDMETPVIFVTGDENPDLLENAGKLDVAAVMRKPVEKDRLINTVRRIMRYRKGGS